MNMILMYMCCQVMRRSPDLQGSSGRSLLQNTSRCALHTGRSSKLHGAGIVSGDQIAVTHTPFMLQDKAAAAAMLSDH